MTNVTWKMYFIGLKFLLMAPQWFEVVEEEIEL